MGSGKKGKEAAIKVEDKHSLVFFICAWLGVVLLLPWNFFINLNGYWMHKFRDTRTSLPLNETLPKFDSMQTFWNSWLSILSMSPNFLFLFLNVIFGHRLRIHPRLFFALAFNLVLFAITIIFTEVNTDSWQAGFYWMSLIFACIFNMNDSIFQGAFAILLGRFPQEYMSALANGQAIGGTFVSLCSIAFFAIGGDVGTMALFSFGVAALFLTSAIVLLIYVSRQPFYLHFYPDELEKVEFSDLVLVLRNTWQFLLAAFLNFFITLSVFPSLFGLTVSIEEENSTWAKYFLLVGGFFVFNFSDLLGRILAGIAKWPKATRGGSWVTLISSLVRLAFIPLFMVCNTNPTNRVFTKVLFHSDLAFFFLNIVFGLSNGYICNICMMCTPKMVAEPKHQSTAASLTAFLSVAGLFIGSSLSFLWVDLL